MAPPSALLFSGLVLWPNVGSPWCQTGLKRVNQTRVLKIEPIYFSPWCGDEVQNSMLGNARPLCCHHQQSKSNTCEHMRNDIPAPGEASQTADQTPGLPPGGSPGMDSTRKAAKQRSQPRPKPCRSVGQSVCQ